jgi:hypothetical protein
MRSAKKKAVQAAEKPKAVKVAATAASSAVE